MSEEKKTHKRKTLFRYLIMVACILLIAAITVIAVAAANNWFRVDLTADNGDNAVQPDTPKPDDGENKPDEDKPTAADNTFAYPVSSINIIYGHEFGEDISLRGCYHFHEGIDLAAEAGTAVCSTLDGTVESVIYDDQLKGNSVTILHENGLKTVYTFIEPEESVKKGAKIKRGEKIGTVSEPTGAEFMQEAHLHFEVIEKGESCDPHPYLDISDK